jgi:hypothetical protein
MGCAASRPLDVGPTQQQQQQQQQQVVYRADVVVLEFPSGADGTSSILSVATSATAGESNKAAATGEARATAGDSSGSSSSSSSNHEEEEALPLPPPPARKAARFAPSEKPAPTKEGSGSSDESIQQRKAAGRVKIWRGQKDLVDMLASIGDFEEFPALATSGTMRQRLATAMRQRPEALHKCYRSACGVLANQPHAPMETQALALALLQTLAVEQQKLSGRRLETKKELLERVQRQEEAAEDGTPCLLS